jgi:WD40 repeat protein
MWSKNVNEVVSTHGYSLNQIIVWRYPSMTKVATLTGHTYRCRLFPTVQIVLDSPQARFLKRISSSPLFFAFHSRYAHPLLRLRPPSKHTHTQSFVFGNVSRRPDDCDWRWR